MAEKIHKLKVGLIAEEALRELGKNLFGGHLAVLIRAAALTIKQEEFTVDEEVWINTQYKKYISRDRSLQ